MIRRKYRSTNQVDYNQGKFIQMQSKEAKNSLLIKKDEKQSFPRVIRMSQDSNKHNESFRSESRQKSIRDIYTPSQQDKLNQSIRKLNTSQSRSSHISANHNSLLRNSNSNNNKSTSRNTSAQQQVRNIQNNITPTDKQSAQSLKSLSKLVNYNLYKSQTSNANRQKIFDQNRQSLQKLNATTKLPSTIKTTTTTTTNQSIIKVKQLQNNNKNTQSQQHIKQRSYNQPQFSDRPQLVEVNGNSALMHNKNLAINSFSTKALSNLNINNSKNNLLTSKSNSQSSPNSRIRSFKYGQEQVLLKENKVIRQLDQPRYIHAKKTKEKFFNQNLGPTLNIQSKQINNSNKLQQQSKQ